MKFAIASQRGSASIYLIIIMVLVSVLSLTYISMINNGYIKSNELIAREKAKYITESASLTLQKMISVIGSNNVNSTMIGNMSCQFINQSYDATNKKCTGQESWQFTQQSLLSFAYPDSKISVEFDGAKGHFTVVGRVGFQGLESSGFRDTKMGISFNPELVHPMSTPEPLDPRAYKPSEIDVVATPTPSPTATPKLVYTHANETSFTLTHYNMFVFCKTLGCTSKNNLTSSNVLFNANPNPASAYTLEPFANMFNSKFNSMFNQKPTNNVLPWTPEYQNSSSCTKSIGPNDYVNDTYQEAGTNDTVKVLNGFTTDCNIDIYFDVNGSPSNNVLKINGDLISGGNITIKNTMSKKFWITGSLKAKYNITSDSGVTIQTNGFHVDQNMIAGGDIRMAFQTQIKVGGTLSSKAFIQFKRAVDNGIYIGKDLIAETGIDFGINSGTDPVAGLYVDRDIIVRNGNFRSVGQMRGMWVRGDIYIPNGTIEFQNGIINGYNQTYKWLNGGNDYPGGQKSLVEGNVLCKNFLVSNDTSLYRLYIKKSLYIDKTSDTSTDGNFTVPYVDYFTVGGNMLVKGKIQITKWSSNEGIRVGLEPTLNATYGYMLANQEIKFNQNNGLIYATSLIGSRDNPINFGKSNAASTSTSSNPTAGYIFGGVWTGGSELTPPLMDATFKNPVFIFHSSVDETSSSSQTSSSSSSASSTSSNVQINGNIYDIVIQ